MAPEAYTLHDALEEWIADKSSEEIRLAAAQTYSKYQDCSLKAAKNLLVSGGKESIKIAHFNLSKPLLSASIFFSA